MPDWGNSFLSVNLKHMACHYCGNVIKDAVWFSIKKMSGHAFAFCSALCEDIWDKKNSA